MHCTIPLPAIATNSTPNDLPLGEIIASAEVDYYVEQQAESIALEPVDEIAARVRLIKLEKIREALVEGEYFSQAKQKCKKLKDFKAWLNKQGFIWKDACKHIKLYETFSSFPLKQIGWVSLDTLFGLLQPKYQELLNQLRSLPQWIDSKIQELMQAVRQHQKAEKAAIEEVTKLEKDAGWRQVPGGGRAFKLPLLHDEITGMRIVQLVEQKYQTIGQVIKEAIAILYARDILGATLSPI